MVDFDIKIEYYDDKRAMYLLKDSLWNMYVNIIVWCKLNTSTENIPVVQLKYLFLNHKHLKNIEILTVILSVIKALIGEYFNDFFVEAILIYVI